MWVKSKNRTSCVQQNASTEYKSATNKAKQLYKAFWVTGTAFFVWKLPMEYGWRTVKDSLHPVYFEGNRSAEFLRDLVCSCKGKSQCTIGEGRGGFARQEVCQTLVWNEARRICFRSGASEGGNITRLASRPVASFTRSLNCQEFFASSLLWRKQVSRISSWSSVFMQGEIAM
jgi:hypothetical protein